MRAVKQYLKKFAVARKVHSVISGPKARRQEASLREVEGREIPPNASFNQLVSKAEAIEGMLSPFSMAVMDMLLSAQNSLGASGNILEIGTFKGKSAVILGSHLRNGERLTLVDINDYLDRNAISPFESAVDFLVTPSEKLRKALPNYRGKHGTYRFIHIDASHGYRETFKELEMAEQLLAPRGVIALDDFTNLNYSQNIAGIFKYLYTASKDLMLFLATDEKGYLCRKRDVEDYLSYVFNFSLAEMRSRGIDATLARTCFDPEYRAFYLRHRQAGESAFYGADIYRSQLTGF